ncbi:MAG: cupin domain-containing protein [bacterium]|nr:cupin domain-containing protein [bacterium]
MPVLGTVDRLKWVYDPSTIRKGGAPRPLATPHIELRIIVLKPGVQPAYHRHQEEMDEGYLIYRGHGVVHHDGEEFEVRAGDVVHVPGGTWHQMKNIGDADLIEFNFRGGKMPSVNILPDQEEPQKKTGGGYHLLGNLDSLKWVFSLDDIKSNGPPTVIATPHLEVRILDFGPGDQPASLHRHQKEMDEIYLVAEGEAHLHGDIGGVDVKKGDVVHIPGGAWHNTENRSKKRLLLFNIRGGRMPSSSEWA